MMDVMLIVISAVPVVVIVVIPLVAVAEFIHEHDARWRWDRHRRGHNATGNHSARYHHGGKR